MLHSFGMLYQNFHIFVKNISLQYVIASLHTLFFIYILYILFYFFCLYGVLWSAWVVTEHTGPAYLSGKVHYIIISSIVIIMMII